jgi:hypothetical protein
MAPGDGPGRLADVIEQLRLQDSRFHVEGGSWTNDLSWVRGYDQVLIPMEQASLLFHERVLARGVSTDDPRYRKALFHLLAAETSCYRYWGQGIWTDYGTELSRRTSDILTHAFDTPRPDRWAGALPDRDDGQPDARPLSVTEGAA